MPQVHLNSASPIGAVSLEQAWRLWIPRIAAAAHGARRSRQTPVLNVAKNAREVTDADCAASPWIEMDITRPDVLDATPVPVTTRISRMHHGQRAAARRLFLCGAGGDSGDERLDTSDAQQGDISTGAHNARPADTMHTWMHIAFPHLLLIHPADHSGVFQREHKGIKPLISLELARIQSHSSQRESSAETLTSFLISCCRFQQVSGTGRHDTLSLSTPAHQALIGTACIAIAVRPGTRNGKDCRASGQVARERAIEPRGPGMRLRSHRSIHDWHFLPRASECNQVVRPCARTSHFTKEP